MYHTYYQFVMTYLTFLLCRVRLAINLTHFSPMNRHLHTSLPTLEDQILALSPLKDHLQHAQTTQQKLDLLSQAKSVHTYLQTYPFIKSLLKNLSPDEVFAIKSLIIIGQAPIVLAHFHDDSDSPALHQLLKVLIDLEQFYSSLGGIVGYHLAVLRLIVNEEKADPQVHYRKPLGIDLTQNSKEVTQAVFWGIHSIPHAAEIYPVGGAADRLDLHEDSTGTPLPAAMLLFEGRTLLEGLIRDIQAREYLYYKLYHKQSITPIAMMTSNEKSNHTHIINLCKSHHYFGRPPKAFFFFLQPLVPVITKEGNWSMETPFQLTLKPGGHGVIWKTAQDQGVFDWLAKHKRDIALIRQINNPLAGTDHNLLALSGLGYQGKKEFGFLSCDRLLNSAEGVNVLKEVKTDNGFDICISNVEYTDMKLKGIKEEPLTRGNPYSQYPANTNTLFANLKAVQDALIHCPIPGQLINMKTKVPYIDANGRLTHIEGGRLESLMQNIADHLVNHLSHRAKDNKLPSLKTFIAYNQRRKTLSTTKKLYQSKGSPIATPEYAFYDRLSNYWDLLTHLCGFKMPDIPPIETYLDKGPPFIVLFHPALGPLYSVIAQKIRGGSLMKGSEMQLEIAEVDFENISLDGSLLIRADNIMGAPDSKGVCHYGEETGKCVLRNVSVKNRGINRQARQCYWKNEIHRHEFLRIHLNGNAEFFAENVVFTGDHQINVPSGYRLIAYQEKGHLSFRREKLQHPTWFWTYSFDDHNRVVLNCHND